MFKGVDDSDEPSCGSTSDENEVPEKLNGYEHSELCNGFSQLTSITSENSREDNAVNKIENHRVNVESEDDESEEEFDDDTDELASTNSDEEEEHQTTDQSKTETITRFVGMKDQATDILSRCPRNVTLKILSYLKPDELLRSVCLVCKTWHCMAYDPALWSHINFTRYVVDDAVVTKIIQLCNFVNYIMFPDANSKDLTVDGMITLAKGCPNLRKFFAPRLRKISDKAMVAFAENCPELRRLHMDDSSITDITLKSIAFHLHNICHLSLSQVGGITEEGVAEVVRSCKNLQSLALCHNKQVTGKFFSAFAESSRSLHLLDLMMCRIDPENVPLIAELTNLGIVNLTQCTNLTVDHFLPVLKSCQKLSGMYLNLCKQVDDEFIDAVFTHLPHLKMISAVSTIITDESLYIMGRKAKALDRVEIGYTKVTSEGVRVLSESCLTLRHFHLTRCDLVEDSDVDKLVEEYPNITYYTFMLEAKRLIKKADEEKAKKAAKKEAEKSKNGTDM